MATLLVAGGYLAYDKIQKSRSKRKARKASEAAALSEQEAQNAERFARLNGQQVDTTTSSSSGRSHTSTAHDSNRNPSITIDGSNSSAPDNSTTQAPADARPQGRHNRSQSASLPRRGRSGSRSHEQGLMSPGGDNPRGRRSFDSRIGLVNSGSARPTVARQSSSYYGSDREDSDAEESRERRAGLGLIQEEPNLWAEPPPNYEEIFGREGRKAG